MPSFRVETPHGSYSAVVERGILARVGERVPGKRGKVFVISTEDVWRHQGAAMERGLA
jgi:3-dehydroquinate synthase